MRALEPAYGPGRPAAGEGETGAITASGDGARKLEVRTMTLALAVAFVAGMVVGAGVIIAAAEIGDRCDRSRCRTDRED